METTERFFYELVITKGRDCGRVSRSFCNPSPLLKFQVIEGPNARNPIAFNAFHSFLEEVQTNAGYMPAARME